MAHITYVRNVAHAGRRPMEELLPQENWNAGFAVFCGTLQQRRAAVLQGIRRCMGRCGIVLLQNDPQLAAELSNAAAGAGVRIYHANPGRECRYDPLYGMTDTAVLDAILPLDGKGFGAGSIPEVRSWLQAYLDIMQIRFWMAPAAFGRYPFNLNLLLQLTEMPYSVLEQQVLQYLPQPDWARIARLLAQDRAVQQVYAAVQSFAAGLKKVLWTPGDFSAHTRISVVESVRQGSIVEIALPSDSPSVLQYLYRELKYLRERNLPFLLAASEVSLAKSPEMCSLFTDPHNAGGYMTGISTGVLSSVVSSPEGLAPLMEEHPEVLLFRCSSVQQAEPFSQALGTYQRRVEDEHTGRSRRPFHLFASHDTGRGIHEMTERNIRTQELLELDDGVILCGAMYETPVHIRQVLL